MYFSSELVECHLSVTAFSFLVQQVPVERNSGGCVLVDVLRVADFIWLALWSSECYCVT